MKVGPYKVKINYSIAQGFIDVMGLILLWLIGQITFHFYETLTTDAYLNSDQVLKAVFGSADAVPVSAWLPGMIWIVIAIAVTVVSIVLTFKSRKLPKKYNITEENAQKYYDIVATAIGLLRILCFLAIFDWMYIHHSILLYTPNVSLFSLQTILDVIVGFIIIRFSMARIKKIETPKDNNSHQIIEN